MDGIPQTGTAWVPVYPDTRRITPETARAFSRLGPYGVDVTPQVKDMASVRRALAAIPHIAVPVDVDDRELMDLRARLQALGNHTVGVDISAGQVRTELADIGGRLSRLSGRTARLDVSVDAGAASAALQGAESEVRRLDGRTARVQVVADVASAVSSIASVIVAVNQLDGRTATINVVADTARAVAGLAMVATRATTIGGAVGGIAALGSVLLALGPAGAVAAGGLAAAVMASGGVGKALSALSAQQDAAGKDAQASAQKQSQSARQVEGAQTRLAEAGTKASQARSDAARSVERAEADAAAGVASARQRVESAGRALQAADAGAAKARRDSARSIADAEQQSARSVASARQSAARAIASAEQQAAAASDRFKRATRELAREQASLTREWEMGRRSLEDLQDQVDGNALDQRQAAFDLADAKKALDEARASGDADQIGRAQLAYDRQLETMDQLNKQTQRLGVDNATAQRAGVAGSEEYRSAIERVQAAQQNVTDAAMAAGQADSDLAAARRDGAVSVAQAEADGAQRVARAREQGAESVAAADARVYEARLALREAEAGVEDARVKGAQRVADAQEQGARSIAAADAAVLDAQRALQDALAATGSEASSTADAVKAAFANLSPAAASFALYLWSLKGLFDQLNATAASGFFPPVQAGLAALVGQFSIFQTVVGQFASALGGALGYVLTQLASPFWTGFFSLLGSVAGPLLMQLAQAFMAVAGVAAQLIVALLPFTPMAIDMLTMVAMLIDAWTPFIAILVGQLLPAAGLVLQALMPLGPVLAALAPILAVLAEAFAMVLGAVLQALAPILVALTPLIQQLALAWGQSLVAAIVAITPLLVAVATWMSQHPQLVIAVVGALGTLLTIWAGMTAVVGAVFGKLLTLRILMNLFGFEAAAAGGLVGGLVSRFTGFFATIFRGTGTLGLFRALLGFVAGLLQRLAAAALAAIGPIGWIAIGLGVLYAQNEAFRGAVNQLLGVLMGLVGVLLSSLAPVLDVVVQVMSLLGQVFAGVAGGLATALVPVVQALADVLAWLTPVIVPLVQVFLAVRAAMLLWAAAQWALNVAMAANPIGLVVVAIAALVGAAVWAYQNLSWFRDIVDAVGAVFVWLWQTVLSPVVDFFRNVFGAVISWISSQWSWLSVVLLFITGPIGFLILAFTTFRDQAMAVFSAIGAAASWFWDTLLSPILSAIWTGLQYLGAIIFTIFVAPFLIAWNLISAIVSWAWTNILQPIWYGAIIPGLQALGAVMSWLCTNVVLPIWNAIGAAISFVWNYIILPVWSAITWYINNVTVPVLQFLFSIYKAIWDAIGAAISFVWNYVILPIWNALVWTINNVLIPATQFLYNNVIKPVWDAIGAAIMFVWTNVISPAFNAVWGGLQWLGDRFRDAVGNIQRIWDGIRGILARPINFMIETVWNVGILKAWNMVAGLVGIPTVQPLQRIEEFAEGGTSENHRAHITPVGGPIRIWSEPETGGEAYIPMATSKRQRSTSILGDVAGRFGYGLVPARDVAMFADGGLWRRLAGVAQGMVPGTRVSSSYRPGDPGYHGSGRAVDLVGNMPAINQSIAQRFPNSSQLIYTPGINLFRGRPHTYNASTRADHFDHVHWAMESEAMLSGAPGNYSGGGGIGSFISTWFKDRARSVFDTVTNPVLDGMRSLMGNPPPQWRAVVPALATKIRDTARDFVFRKADEKDAAASSDAALGPLGAGAPFYVGEISRAARDRALGKEGATIGVATALVESGLRMYANRAVPGSLSLPHEAVGSDHDSVGLFQQRQAGWGTLQQRMNPYASAALFFNRLMSFNWRGMDPGAAAQRVQVSAFPGRYSTQMGRARGLVDQFGGPFDDGGWAMGKGVMFKDIIAPERVLDPVESEAGYRPLVKLSAQLSQGQVPVASAETAAVRAAALTARPAPAASTPNELVAHLYDTSGVLLGTIRGEVDHGMRELADSINDGSS